MIDVAMAKFTQHIFVCCNQRPDGHPRGCCSPDGGTALKDALKTELTRRGLKPQVRANAAGCLDQCELGPTLVIYPQQIWYGGVRIADAERIVEKTILEGEILNDLLITDDLLNTKGGRLKLGDNMDPSGQSQ